MLLLVINYYSTISNWIAYPCKPLTEGKWGTNSLACTIERVRLLMSVDKGSLYQWQLLQLNQTYYRTNQEANTACEPELIAKYYQRHQGNDQGMPVKGSRLPQP